MLQTPNSVTSAQRIADSKCTCTFKTLISDRSIDRNSSIKSFNSFISDSLWGFDLSNNSSSGNKDHSSNNSSSGGGGGKPQYNHSNSSTKSLLPHQNSSSMYAPPTTHLPHAPDAPFHHPFWGSPNVRPLGETWSSEVDPLNRSTNSDKFGLGSSNSSGGQ